MMDSCVTIQAWPQTLNCLSWSADCDLAVAAGENVEVLIPKTRFDGKKDNSEESQWYRVRLQVNLFTTREVPYVRPLGFDSFSIGEEQSLSSVLTVAWSPTGLAKHRRCALAVLTANHVLSIWTSDAHPKDPRSWKRVLVVNNGLQQYFESLDISQEYVQDERVLIKLRARVRSFCWAPNPRDATSSMKNRHAHRFCPGGIHFLAVANDNNEIVVLEIISPYKSLVLPRLEWTVRVCTHFKTSYPVVEIGFPSIPSVLSPQTFVECLAWSPWIEAANHGDGNLRSNIAYIVKSQLRARKCTMGVDDFEPVLDIRQEERLADEKHVGPLKWVNVVDEGRMHLVSFTRTHVFHIDLLNQDQPIAESATTVTSHKKIPCWEPVSGVALTGSRSRCRKTHYVTHISFAHKTDCAATISCDIHANKCEPTWAEAIQRQKALFSAEHNLSGKVTARIWGLDSSPEGDCIATCFSLHPSDMIQYAMTSEQKSIIAFVTCNNSLILFNGLENTSLGDVSMESMTFSIFRWLKETSVKAQLDKHHLNELHEMLIVFSAPVSTSHHPEGNRNSLHTIVDGLKKGINMRKSYSEEITSYLAASGSLQSRSISDKSTSQRDILWYLCSNVLLLGIGSNTITILGGKILQLYSKNRLKMAEQWPDTYSVNEDPRRDGHVDIMESAEQCDICNAQIDFEDTQWARCKEGHQFVRCCLTLLAIQAPGISKFCGLCGRQYLNEYLLLENDKILDTHSEEPLTNRAGESNPQVAFTPAIDGTSPMQGNAISTLSLPQVLFTVYDVCIFCGGKFVG